MTATWEYSFDDGSGSSQLMISHPASSCAGPPKHSRLSGSWTATVTSSGVMTITALEAKVSDLMMPLPGTPATATNWIELATPTFTLAGYGAHPHDAALPDLNTGRVDLTNRYATLSWGINVASSTLDDLELPPLTMVFSESGYLHPDHAFGMLAGCGRVTAPIAFADIIVLTSNSVRVISALAP